MPEYLTPGVYVEETSFRSRPVQGVPTATFGMAGRTQYGPVPYALPAGPTMVPEPTLVTSITEYDRAFGGLTVDGPDDPCWLAHAARAFFANGGRRLYVSRVFTPTETAGANPQVDVAANFASLPAPAAGAPVAVWRARWPGSAGRRIQVSTGFRRSGNVIIGGVLRGVRPGAAVEVLPVGAPRPGDRIAPVAANVRVVAVDGQGNYGFVGAGGAFAAVPANIQGFHLAISATVTSGDRSDVYSEMELAEPHPRAITRVLQPEDPPDEFSLIWLDVPAPAPAPGALLTTLLGTQKAFLTGGGGGATIDATALIGRRADAENLARPATGLTALGELEDVAIVAVPDIIGLPDDAARRQATDGLIAHCEALRYRIAVVDPPPDCSLSQVRRFRAQFDSTYAALYYPWVKVVDPSRKPDPGGPTPMLDLPPSGFVAGVYARTDAERGVHKAPANEVVLGVDRFVTTVTGDRQAVLNPEGINALRFFEGRANRIWGARTMSSDPEWTYVNVRRLFIYLEHSIEKSTQWAVFEPNNQSLWSSIRQSIEDFLLVAWRSGALMGNRPEEAFFVRCDRTTMTQNDLDNGRLICLIGVAPTYPAEFVIFRIGQWTADARRA